MDRKQIKNKDRKGKVYLISGSYIHTILKLLLNAIFPSYSVHICVSFAKVLF